MRNSLLVIAILSLSTPMFAQIDAKVERELQSSYAKVIVAMKKKDVKGIMNMMTLDATFNEIGQKMTRDKFEQQLTTSIKTTQFESSLLIFSKIVVNSGVAHTEYTEFAKVKMPGMDGKTANFEMKTKYKSTFKKIGKDWKMQYNETVGTPEVKMNGKPVKMGVPQK